MTMKHGSVHWTETKNSYERVVVSKITYYKHQKHRTSQKNIAIIQQVSVKITVRAYVLYI